MKLANSAEKCCNVRSFFFPHSHRATAAYIRRRSRSPKKTFRVFTPQIGCGCIGFGRLLSPPWNFADQTSRTRTRPNRRHRRPYRRLHPTPRRVITTAVGARVLIASLLSVSATPHCATRRWLGLSASWRMRTRYAFACTNPNPNPNPNSNPNPNPNRTS